MKFSTFVAAAVSSAVAVSASPVHKREVGGVVLCTGANATGDCNYSVYPLNECVQLEAPFYRNASTMAVDGEPFFCFPRAVNCTDICTSPTGCSIGEVDFSYRYKYDLSAVKWNTLISSLWCELKTN